jgi:serine/threonine protein phosphatase PrpC
LRSEILCGREHPQIGAIDLIAEGECAVAISRGGAAKTYSHTDPNEDACLFVWGPNGVLVAVADGHHGASGAEVAVRHLAEVLAAPAIEHAGPLDRDRLLALADQAMDGAHSAIVDEAARCELPPAPTTLSFALARPAEGLLLHASIGDSHIFCTRNDGALVDLGWDADPNPVLGFLGDPMPRGPGSWVRSDCLPLADVEALVLVTDGFSEEGIGFDDPAAQMRHILEASLDDSVRADRKPVLTCRTVMESAMACQRRNRSGDNLGCAVWVAPDGT